MRILLQLAKATDKEERIPSINGISVLVPKPTIAKCCRDVSGIFI